MVKVAKIQLLIEEPEGMSYKEVKNVLWELQKENREIANKTVQLAWELLIGNTLYKKIKDTYLSKEQISEGITDGVTPLAYYYRVISQNYTKLYSGNRMSFIREVESRFRKDTKEYLAGTKSIMHFKRDIPIYLTKKCIALKYDTENGDWGCDLTLLSSFYKKELGLEDSFFSFKMVVKDNSTRTILERCYDGVYEITASKMVKKDAKWYLQLGYNPKAAEEISHATPNKENVCGVFIGEYNSIFCTNNLNDKCLVIEGLEIEQFRAQIEKRRKDILNSRPYCGEGSVGHGRKTRLAPTEKLSDKISNFRKTTNHKYAKGIVQYAEMHQCGTIVIEDLTGVSDKNKQLKNWSYYDLQEKITYKAQAKGITTLKKSISASEIVCEKCGTIFINTGENKKLVCECCGEKLKKPKKDNICYNCGESSEQTYGDKMFECKHCGIKIEKDRNKSLLLAFSQNKK